jgi:hypothetical protein
MELWTHVLEEFAIRCGPNPGGFSKGIAENTHVPNPGSPLAERASRLVSDAGTQPTSALFKYGQVKYLRQAATDGTLRVAPASMYRVDALELAIRDDELTRSLTPPPLGFRVLLKDRLTATPSTPFILSHLEVTNRMQSDYYLLCFSEALLARLFVDFSADSVLVIENKARFVDDLITTMRRHLPRWAAFAGPVSYVDPVLPSAMDVPLPLTKHFRYSYQQEFRLAWCFSEPPDPLQPLLVQLPCLPRYSRLLTL